MNTPSEEVIRSLINERGDYMGAGKPIGHKPYFKDIPLTFKLSPNEVTDLQSMGVDLTGEGIIPTGDIADYKTMRAIGGQEYEQWKAMRQQRVKDRMLGPLGHTNSRINAGQSSAGSFRR